MDKLRELQLAELEIVKKFIKLCKENNLRYFILGGTLLGAVRHKGFIPWDDDIDIGMPREDYEKLIHIWKNLSMASNFKLVREKHKYFIRVVNEKMFVKLNMGNKAEVIGAWIDIFPLDGIPKNKILKSVHMFKILFWRMMFQYANFDRAVNITLKKRPFYEKILIKIGYIFEIEKILGKFDIYKKLDNCLKKYNYDKFEYVGNFMGAYKFKEMFPKKIYDEVQEYEFENIKLLGPREYDFVLKQLYGNYMKLPDINDRNKHQLEILDDGEN